MQLEFSIISKYFDIKKTKVFKGIGDDAALFIKDKKILEGVKNSNLPLYNFLVNKWYIDEVYDFVFIKPLKKIGVFFWKKGDQDTIDRFGPDGISRVIKYISNKAVQFQSGYIYDYAFVMLIGLSALITYLILN